MDNNIKQILLESQLTDLNRNIKRKHCLNNSNIYLVYLFNLVQTAGIFSTTYGTSVNNINIVWIGISLNLLASLINVYEKTNNNLIKKLTSDIHSIKIGEYESESQMIDIEEPKKE